jgi:hypothetical protein
VVAGSVTPPVEVLVPAGSSTTVPPDPAETATLPKFISTVLLILMAVRILAVAVAVAVAWADAADDPTIVPNKVNKAVLSIRFIFS